MKRLREEDINKPEQFNHVWELENVHRYDVVRLLQFLSFIDPEHRILDVGAGWWGIAQYATANNLPGKYTALDFSEEARRRTLEITPTLDYVIGNALAMPFADSTFDRVCCGELIEHMQVPAALVAEMFRVCKPGGSVIIGTLVAECEAAQAHGEYPEHLYAFLPEDLKEMILEHADRSCYWLCPGGQYHFVMGVKP